MERLKKLYRMLALLALLHAAAAAAFIAYLAVEGKLSVEKVRSVVDVVRGPEAGTGATASADAAANEVEADGATPTTMPAAALPPNDDEQEIARLNLERVRMQAQDQLILARRQMLDVNRQREDFQEMVARQQQLQQQRDKELDAAAFEKELEELSQMKPKIALDRLLLRPVEDAAWLLMAMDTRQSKKITEAAHKDAASWSRMMEILDRKRQLIPDDAGNGGAGEVR